MRFVLLTVYRRAIKSRPISTYTDLYGVVIINNKNVGRFLYNGKRCTSSIVFFSDTRSSTRINKFYSSLRAVNHFKPQKLVSPSSNSLTLLSLYRWYALFAVKLLSFKAISFENRSHTRNRSVLHCNDPLGLISILHLFLYVLAKRVLRVCTATAQHVNNSYSKGSTTRICGRIHSTAVFFFCSAFILQKHVLL